MHETAGIKGEIIKAKTTTLMPFYGCLSIDEGIHSCQIKTKTPFDSSAHFLCIGIIKDTEENLKKDYNWDKHVEGNGCCLASVGRFYRGGASFGNDFMDEFIQIGIGAMVTMTLDMNKHTLSY